MIEYHVLKDPKKWIIKEKVNKLDYIKIRNFCISSGSVR